MPFTLIQVTYKWNAGNKPDIVLQGGQLHYHYRCPPRPQSPIKHTDRQCDQLNWSVCPPSVSRVYPRASAESAVGPVGCAAGLSALALVSWIELHLSDRDFTAKKQQSAVKQSDSSKVIIHV